MISSTQILKVACGAFLGACLFVGHAIAAPILCSTDPTKNRMSIDGSQVSACLAHGTGNLTGNPKNDLFLNGAGAGYEFAGKKEDSPSLNPFNILYTQSGATGTWSFDSSFWDTYGSGAIAFKFGTGNKPDQWFVYSLHAGTTSGDWEFINKFGRGGGLSHVNLYGMGPALVPEPGTLSLLGLGILGLALAKRRSSRT